MDSGSHAGAPVAVHQQPTSVLLAACWISAAGALLFNSLPAFLTSAAAHYTLSSSQLGLVGVGYGAGFAAVTVTTFFWIARVNWRRLVIAATAMTVIGFTACAVAPDVGVVIAVLVGAGLGCGALYTVGVAVVSEHHNPDRAFGVKLAIETFVGVAMLVAVPNVFFARWGFPGVAFAMAGVAGLCGLLAYRSTPVAREASNAPGAADGAGATQPATAYRGLAWFGLAGLLVLFGGNAALWAYLERIAPTFGLAGPLTGDTVVGIQVVNALSAVAAAVIGDRWGRALPLSVALLAALAGVFALAVGHDLFSYLSGAILTYGMLNIPLSYQMGLIASADSTGRVSAQIPAAMSIGGAAGPALAGSMLEGSGYFPLYAFTAATIVIALLVFVSLARRVSHAA